MLTVYKQSWSEDISLFSVFHWEIGKMKEAKKIQRKKMCAYPLEQSSKLCDRH